MISKGEDLTDPKSDENDSLLTPGAMSLAIPSEHLVGDRAPIVQFSKNSLVVAVLTVTMIRWMLRETDGKFGILSCQRQNCEPEVLHQDQSLKEQCHLLPLSSQHSHDIQVRLACRRGAE